MKIKMEMLQSSPLFAGIDPAEYQTTLNCLSAVQKKFRKDEYVLRSGKVIDSFGMVLSGTVLVIWEDFWGNRNIIADVWPGEIFGESYAFLPGELLRVSAVAAEASAVMMIDARHMLEICSSACRFHTRLVQNMLAESAKKNLALTRKLSHMSKRSTREKLLSYLSG